VEEQTLSSAVQTPEGAKQKFYGTGRRKESVARVYVTFGSGKISINGRGVDEYFRNVNWRNRALEPLKFTDTVNAVDVIASVNGGGVGGQSGAFRMGLSRALAMFNTELRPGLRKNGFLTRDSRMKERKKYGQKGARKRFQYSKR
jgi:small subunit ribosomal protein S9